MYYFSVSVNEAAQCQMGCFVQSYLKFRFILIFFGCWWPDNCIIIKVWQDQTMYNLFDYRCWRCEHFLVMPIPWAIFWDNGVNVNWPGPRFPITMDLRSYDHSHDGSCEPSWISLERFAKLLLTWTRVHCTHNVRRIVTVYWNSAEMGSILREKQECRRKMGLKSIKISPHQGQQQSSLGK